MEEPGSLINLRWPFPNLDKLLWSPWESPLDCKEIQTVNPKGNQSWIIIGRTDAEAETIILWPPDMKGWLIRKDSDAGKDWRQEEKGTTEDEMAGCHHWLNGHEFEQSPGDGEGQGNLACCSPQSLKRVGHDWVTEQQPPLVYYKGIAKREKCI